MEYSAQMPTAPDEARAVESFCACRAGRPLQMPFWAGCPPVDGCPSPSTTTTTLTRWTPCARVLIHVRYIEYTVGLISPRLVCPLHVRTLLATCVSCAVCCNQLPPVKASPQGLNCMNRSQLRRWTWCDGRAARTATYRLLPIHPSLPYPISNPRYWLGRMLCNVLADPIDLIIYAYCLDPIDLIIYTIAYPSHAH